MTKERLKKLSQRLNEQVLEWKNVGPGSGLIKQVMPAAGDG
jgi:hypothetical protein